MTAHSKYVYSVIDAETNKVLWSDLSASQVNEKTGLQSKKAAKYATDGILFNRKYKFSKTEPSTDPECRVPDYLLKDYDNTVEMIKRTIPPEILRRITFKKKGE